MKNVVSRQAYSPYACRAPRVDPAPVTSTPPELRGRLFIFSAFLSLRSFGSASLRRRFRKSLLWPVSNDETQRLHKLILFGVALQSERPDLFPLQGRGRETNRLHASALTEAAISSRARSACYVYTYRNIIKRWSAHLALFGLPPWAFSP
jgi:hypothetical protein